MNRRTKVELSPKPVSSKPSIHLLNLFSHLENSHTEAQFSDSKFLLEELKRSLLPYNNGPGESLDLSELMPEGAIIADDGRENNLTHVKATLNRPHDLPVNIEIKKTVDDANDQVGFSIVLESEQVKLNVTSLAQVGENPEVKAHWS